MNHKADRDTTPMQGCSELKTKRTGVMTLALSSLSARSQLALSSLSAHSDVKCEVCRIEMSSRVILRTSAHVVLHVRIRAFCAHSFPSCPVSRFCHLQH